MDSDTLSLSAAFLTGSFLSQYGCSLLDGRCGRETNPQRGREASLPYIPPKNRYMRLFFTIKKRIPAVVRE